MVQFFTSKKSPDSNQPEEKAFIQANQPSPDFSSELQAVLQQIVNDVVTGLDCIGAVVAPLEGGDTLPVRAYKVNFNEDILEVWEKRLGISFLNSKAVAYLDDRKFKDNLGVRAVKGVNGRPVKYLISNSLHDLFRPVVNKVLSDVAQKAIGVKQVIAVPFFLEDEVVGNLFAAATREFSKRDIDFLTALGHQAAIAIQSQQRLADIQALERVIFTLQASMTDEEQILKTIVDAVVHEFGYLGAMVAPLEGDNALPVRAYAVAFGQDIVETWEKRLGIGFLNAKSVAYLDNERFKDNLSIRAVKGVNGRPVKYLVSDSLHDLFRPVVNKVLSDVAQKAVGIKQVVAVPFFLEDEVVGNLFVATQKPKFSTGEMEILTILGQQAAVGIRNARIYRKSEERRQVAQMFARMAFSSTAYVHAFRNHVGSVRMYIQLTKAQLSETFQEMGGKAIERLNEVADILDNLHEPWRDQPDAFTDVNLCLKRAIDKIVPDRDELKDRDGIIVQESLLEDLPQIRTSPDMLTEAFRVLIKNALEAIKEKNKKRGISGTICITSSVIHDSLVEVTIRDDGIGIEPQNLVKIFEMRWSTKDVGMGFGLFWTRDYVEGLKGTIEVESEWQVGTTFRIRLPLCSQ